jgi:hypothetical protein
MDTMTVVLLIVIAAISIVQTTLLVRLWREGRRTAAGLDRLGERLVNDVTPAMRDLGRAAANTERLSSSVLLELQRVDALVEDVAGSWSRGTARLHEALVPNLGRMAVAAAAWRLLRRARSVYRFFR